jgi:hypothetical protein
MITDREILEKRITLCQEGSWVTFREELIAMSESLEKIYDIDNEKDLRFRQGQLSMLNMFINLEDSSKIALDNLDD